MESQNVPWWQRTYYQWLIVAITVDLLCIGNVAIVPLLLKIPFYCFAISVARRTDNIFFHLLFYVTALIVIVMNAFFAFAVLGGGAAFVPCMIVEILVVVSTLYYRLWADDDEENASLFKPHRPQWIVAGIAMVLFCACYGLDYVWYRDLSDSTLSDRGFMRISVAYAIFLAVTAMGAFVLWKWRDEKFRTITYLVWLGALVSAGTWLVTVHAYAFNDYVGQVHSFNSTTQVIPFYRMMWTIYGCGALFVAAFIAALWRFTSRPVARMLAITSVGSLAMFAILFCNNDNRLHHRFVPPYETGTPMANVPVVGDMFYE